MSEGTWPAGATFIVQFDDLDGGPSRGAVTLASRQPARAAVLRLDSHTFRITLADEFRAGNAYQGYWSDSHGFAFGRRDKVTIRLESTGGATDSNPLNDVAVYDNGGRGF